MKGSLCEEFVKWYLYNIEGSEIMGGGCISRRTGIGNGCTVFALA